MTSNGLLLSGAVGKYIMSTVHYEYKYCGDIMCRAGGSSSSMVQMF
jgi:hypothetical protein